MNTSRRIELLALAIMGVSFFPAGLNAKFSDIRSLSIHVAKSSLAEEDAVEWAAREIFEKYLPSIKLTTEYSEVNLLIDFREVKSPDGKSVFYTHGMRVSGNGSDNFGLFEKIYWAKTLEGVADLSDYEETWKDNLKRLTKTFADSFGQEDTMRAQVVGVHDGDTLTVFSREGTEKMFTIRLHNVDCPELAQPYGQEALAFTNERALGKDVTVRVDQVDRYGRVLGEVTLPSGRSLNQDLLKAGMAWWYNKYSKDSSLATLESEAEEKKKGLWADENPVPPWEFRKEKR